VYHGNVDVKTRGRRPGRRRALTEAQEWIVYARVDHGGEPVAKVAAELGVSSRTVYNVVARRRRLARGEGDGR
jgi:transposase